MPLCLPLKKWHPHQQPPGLWPVVPCIASLGAATAGTAAGATTAAVLQWRACHQSRLGTTHGGFQSIGVPPNHPFLDGIFMNCTKLYIVNHTDYRVPQYGEQLSSLRTLKPSEPSSRVCQFLSPSIDPDRLTSPYIKGRAMDPRSAQGRTKSP